MWRDVWPGGDPDFSQIMSWNKSVFDLKKNKYLHKVKLIVFLFQDIECNRKRKRSKQRRKTLVIRLFVTKLVRHLRMQRKQNYPPLSLCLVLIV